MDKVIVKIVKEITTLELTTDDIELVLRNGLELPGNAKFSWNTGQWPSLTIRSEMEKVEHNPIGGDR